MKKNKSRSAVFFADRVNVITFFSVITNVVIKRVPSYSFMLKYTLKRSLSTVIHAIIYFYLSVILMRFVLDIPLGIHVAILE